MVSIWLVGYCCFVNITLNLSNFTECLKAGLIGFSEGYSVLEVNKSLVNNLVN